MASTLSKYMTFKIGVAILVILHIVGLFGLLFSPESVLALTPINILISTVLVFTYSNDRSVSFFGVSLLIAVIGYCIELVGIRTGAIFGDYSYGETLGYKLYNVPLIMGCNWIMLLYGVAQTSSNVSESVWVRALTGASLMMGIDFLIEPVAINYDFWKWKGDSVPPQNYIAWFLISFVILLISEKILNKRTNKLAIVLFITQLLFFLIIDLVSGFFTN